MNGATIFFKSFQRIDRFLEKGRPSKIRLVQCYVLVLWIYVIDMICKKEL